MSLLWAALIVVAVTVVAIGAMLLVRRSAPEGSYFEDGDRAAGVFGVLATGFAVLLGFVVFLAFESFDTSRSGAVTEAETIAEQFERYLKEYDNYDFFFIHYKYTDKYGEDGNFAAKKKAIEDFDAALPILLKKKPDVLAITGDHSTPCALHGHSWHPQPVLLHSVNSGSDKLERFTETGANIGSLGVFEAKFLMRLMQANAKMFDKFGA